MTLLGWIRVINRPKDLQGVVGEGCKDILYFEAFCLIVWDYTGCKGVLCFETFCMGLYTGGKGILYFETFCMGLKGMPGKSITGAFEGLHCGLYRGSS